MTEQAEANSTQKLLSAKTNYIVLSQDFKRNFVLHNPTQTRIVNDYYSFTLSKYCKHKQSPHS